MSGSLQRRRFSKLWLLQPSRLSGAILGATAYTCVYNVYTHKVYYKIACTYKRYKFPRLFNSTCIIYRVYMNSILDVHSIDLTSPQLLHASLIRSSHSNRIQQKSMPINRLYCQLGPIICYLPHLKGTRSSSIQPTSLPEVATNFPNFFRLPKPWRPCRNYAMSHQETWREPITCTSARRLTGPMELTFEGLENT